ncbi:MAG: hypothetical protein J7498_12085 [Sphingobium sp.]|nr:hypothetical protein [Sphingobium sp.]
MRHDFKLTGNQAAYPLAAGATEVDRDMEGIFGTAGHRAVDPDSDPDPVVSIAGAKPAKRRSWLPAIAVAMLAGPSIAGGAVWMALQPASGTPAPSQAAAPVQAPTPMPTPAPMPIKVAAPAEVAARPEPVMRPPVARVSRAPAPIAEAAAPKPMAAAPHHKPKATPRVRASDGKRLDGDVSPRMRATSSYPDLAAADREMREAYARAAYVGLDPKVLRIYRTRWQEVREMAGPDPAYAVEAYYQLARQLDAARRGS